MNIRRTLLRGATVLTLAMAIVGTSTLAPAASASPLDDLSVAESVKATMNKPKVDNDNDVSAVDDTGIADIPIIGDVVGGFKDAEPEEIVTGAIQFAGAAAETIVPLIRGFIK
jgi:hypothetical protein